MAKLSGSLCFERKTTKRKKRKSQRIFEVGEKSCFKLHIHSLRLNPKYKLSEKDVKSCGVPFASRCEFD